MAASHRDSPEDYLFSHYDEQQNNEHSSRQRWTLPGTRFAGDGFDFRRPVMTASNATSGASAEVNGGADQADEGSVRRSPPVIDLTREDSAEDSHMHGGNSYYAPPPVTATSSRPQRAPRFGRNVLADDEEEDRTSASTLPGASYLALPPGAGFAAPVRPQFSLLRRPQRPPSPLTAMNRSDEFEVLGEHSRSRRSLHSRGSTPAGRVPPRSITPYPDAIDLTADDDDDDVVLVESRPRSGMNNLNNGGANLAPPILGNNPNYRTMGQIANMIRENGIPWGGRLMQRFNGLMAMEAAGRNLPAPPAHPIHRPQPRRHRQEHRASGFGALRPGNMPGGPVMMDYDMTGFDLGIIGARENRPPTPKYSPPPEPEEGFTRNPGEDEVVVCPNCGDELGMGAEEGKREVWVVKSCGHAYCGECAQNRGKGTTPKKGKGRSSDGMKIQPTTMPFRKCVVEGCGKAAGKSSMIRVYLDTGV